MMNPKSFSLVLIALFFICGCQNSEQPAPSATPVAETTSTPAPNPSKKSSFTVEITKGPSKPVEIWWEGPTKEKRTVAPDELTQTFELSEGIYDLTVRSEGCRNFALRVQIPEMTSVKAVMERLPNDVGRDAPVDDPFKR